jgi:hypothetical protein
LLDRSRYFKHSRVFILLKLERSIILLQERSSLSSIGKDTKFSIFDIQLLLKLISLTFSSPSKSGIWLRFHPYKFIAVGDFSLSAGLL